MGKGIFNILTALLFSFVLLSAQQGKPSVAVIGFDGKGVNESDAEVIEELFRTELVNTEMFNVLDRANMDVMLKEAEFQQSGCTESSCAIEIGKMLNMRYMFYGSLMNIGQTYIINVGMVDIESSMIIKSEKATFGKIDDSIKIISSLAISLSGALNAADNGGEPAVSDGSVPFKTNAVSNSTEQPQRDRNTGMLVIDAMPTNAVVLINDSIFGTAPFDRELEKGRYSVTVRMQGYHDSNFSVETAAGQSLHKYVELEKITKPEQFVINSEPSSANVYVNGELVASTPYTSSRLPGTYIVEVRKDGYITERFTVNIEEGQGFAEDVKLISIPETQGPGVLFTPFEISIKDDIAFSSIFNRKGKGVITLAGFHFSRSYIERFFGVNAGFGVNYVNETSVGLSLAGGVNYGWLLFGASLSLGANNHRHGVAGLQLAPYNLAAHSYIAQVGGVNISGGLFGVQVGGFNIAEVGFIGAQGGGMNLSQDFSGGFQIGVYNRSAFMGGVQWGIVNVSDEHYGLQLGVFNYCGSDIRGIQFGIANIARKLGGLQIGLVNRCYDFVGLQIGLLNFCESEKLSVFPFIRAGLHRF